MTKPWIVYLSGPITGERYAKEKFEKAEKVIRMAAANTKTGVYIMNPFARHPAGLSNEQYMKLSFAEIECCTDLALLPGWDDSDGCSIELAYADYIGKWSWQMIDRFPEFYEEERG